VKIREFKLEDQVLQRVTMNTKESLEKKLTTYWEVSYKVIDIVSWKTYWLKHIKAKIEL